MATSVGGREGGRRGEKERGKITLDYGENVV
jgi:hypothetical protein